MSNGGAFTGQQNEKEGSSDSSSDDLEEDNDDDDDDREDVAPDNSDSFEKEDMPAEVDFDAEADVAKKVLKNLISSSSKGTIPSDVNDSTLPKGKKKPNSDENVDVPNEKSSEQDTSSGITLPESSGKNSSSDIQKREGEDDLQRTVFISNLPFDVDNEEVKQRFSAFGEVKSFVPVLHQVTKYGVINPHMFFIFPIL